MLWQSDEYYFSRLKKEQLKDMLEFYLIEIYEHFNYGDYTKESYEAELAYLLQEDMAFFDNSVYYVLRETESDRIVGSIKTTYWDEETKLPIEELFNLRISKTNFPEYKHFWHLGRFVVSQKIPSNRICILKQMLFNAFYPVYALEKGLIIAECDKKVALTLRRMGIDFFELGESIEYICSETIPIYIKSDWLSEFMSTSSDRYFSPDNFEDFHFFTKIGSEHTKAKRMLAYHIMFSG